jgi:hypothetical protein
MELHLNYIEALWLAANAVALYFTALNYTESREQKEALHPLRNGRLIVVNGTLRRDKNRLLKIIAMLAVGVWGALTPGEVQNPVGAFLLLFIPYLLLFDSAADNRDRRRLVESKKIEVLQEEGWDGSERRRSN